VQARPLPDPKGRGAQRRVIPQPAAAPATSKAAGNLSRALICSLQSSKDASKPTRASAAQAALANDFEA
jgi:hypothetical protein